MKVAVIHVRYKRAEADGPDAMANAWAHIKANTDVNYAMIDKAGAAGADICVTSECFACVGRGLDTHNDARFIELVGQAEEQIAGELSKRAKQYNMMIASNEYGLHNGDVYNTSTLFGRGGNIIGKFRKVHLPTGERFTAHKGTEFPVFKTDIGNIGFAICYDIIFPEHCRILALNGADIVIHQTQGWGLGCGQGSLDMGEALLRVRAAENGVCLIMAKVIQGEGGMSCVVDNNGDIVARQPGNDDALLITEFTPDFTLTDPYYYGNYYTGQTSGKANILLAREPSVYGRLTEGAPVFSSDELKGARLNTREEYLERARALKDMPEEEAKQMHWGKHWREVFQRNNR